MQCTVALQASTNARPNKCPFALQHNASNLHHLPAQCLEPLSPRNLHIWAAPPVCTIHKGPEVLQIPEHHVVHQVTPLRGSQVDRIKA